MTIISKEYCCPDCGSSLEDECGVRAEDDFEEAEDD